MSLRTLSVLALAAAMQLSAVEAHVRLLYTGTPIRNANSAVTDGQYSVNGPCGGQQTFARNGQKTVTSGQALALKVAYNGDHRSAANAFRVTMQCTAPGGNVPANDAGLRGNTNLLPNSPNIPAADSSTAGYAVNLNLPAKPDGTKCTLAVLDQREWGGCIDMVYGAAAPATTKPPTAAPGQITTIAPTTPSMYAGDVVSGMWSIRGCLDTVLGCCCMKGTISVQHASGAATASATGTLAPIAGSPSTCPAASSFTTSLTGNEVGVWSAVGVTTTNSQGDTFEIQGLNKADAMWEVTNVAADKPQICSMAVMKGAAAADPVNDPNNIPTATTPAPAGPDTTSAPSNPNTNAPTQTPTTTRPVKPSVGAAASVSASAMLVALLALAAFFLTH